MTTPINLCVDHSKLWTIHKEIGIPDHLTCLLRNLYAGKEATVRTGHGTTDWLQIGKGEHQGCILSPCLFNFYAENPKDSTRKLLELINEYSKVAGYKINTQKSLAFPYTNNEKIDKLREIKRN